MTSPVRRLLPYAGRYRRAFLLGFVCVIVTTAVTLLSPWILKYAIDDLTAGVTRAKLAFYAGLLVGVAGAGGVFRFLMRRIIVGASRQIEYDIRNAFYARLQQLPVEYFQRHRIGDLMSRATNDLNAVRMMIGPAVMYAASTGLVFVVAVVLMVSIDARLTALALLPLPIATAAVKVFGAAIHRRFERIQAQLSEISAVVQESLSGVRVVRAYRQEAVEIDRFERASAEYVARSRRLIAIQSVYYPTLAFVFGLGALVVLWLGSRAVIAGRITLGEFVAFNAYLVMLTWPMIAFGWVTNLLQRGMASWKRMLEVLDATPVDAGGTARLPEGGLRGGVEIRDLTFAFDGRPALEGVSLRIEPGETVALVGPTGAGKSTLIALVARLYEPPRGTVFVGGLDVRDLPLATLRAAIGFVPQEPFLFSDTIAANIAFGLPDGPEVDRDARIRRAAVVAGLERDLEAFPKGYGTLVGERGLTLSGGQKQRTALARAIATDPALLVLDDALSAVDTYTEEVILERLREVMRQRTCIIVSHRVSTVRHADRIFVLDNGRVVERGTHAELVAHGGLYAGLHRKQLLEEELGAA